MISFSGWMAKQTGPSYYGLLLRNKKKQVWTYTAAWLGLQRVVPNGKKPIPKAYILDDCIYLTLLKWQNYRNGHRVVIARGEAVGEGGPRAVGTAVRATLGTFVVMGLCCRFIPVRILVGLSCCRSVRCYQGENWVGGISALFLIKSCESTKTSKWKF